MGGGGINLEGVGWMEWKVGEPISLEGVGWVMTPNFGGRLVGEELSEVGLAGTGGVWERTTVLPPSADATVTLSEPLGVVSSSVDTFSLPLSLKGETMGRISTPFSGAPSGAFG